MYRQYAEMLIENGSAYYAFDTTEELESMRQRLKAEGNNSFQYDSASRGSMKNSITLSAEDVKSRIERGDHYVVRAKIPANESPLTTSFVEKSLLIQISLMIKCYKSDGWYLPPCKHCG
jgi:glutamyl-tRNA synthetase